MRKKSMVCFGCLGVASLLASSIVGCSDDATTPKGSGGGGSGGAGGAGGGSCDPATESCGEPLWSKSFGGAEDDEVGALSSDGDGNIYVIGSFAGSADFGGGALDSAGGSDVFVVKLSAEGEHLWSKRLGGANDDFGNGIAVDARGDVYVVGAASGAIDFGGGMLTTESSDLFVAKYSSDGAHLWSAIHGGASSDYPLAFAADDAGNLVVAGVFHGAASFGGDPLQPVDTKPQHFVVAYGPDGSHRWSSNVGPLLSSQEGPVKQGLALADDGSVYFTGAFFHPTDFGGGELATTGGNDIFVVKYDASGAHLWSRSYGGGPDDNGIEDDYGYDAVVDGEGGVVVTGAFRGAIDFGGGELVSAGLQDGFVLKLDAAGDHVWSSRYGETQGDGGYGLALGADGQLLLTGRGDTLAALYAADGELVWSKPRDEHASNHGWSIAWSGERAAVAGVFRDALDLGTGELVSAGGYDVFVALLEP